MRVLIAPTEQIRRLSEERIAVNPPVFELGSRCTGCGLIFHVRQAFDRLD